MAWGDKTDYTDIDKSSYNEAGLKMVRLYETQRLINFCSRNKLAFNIEYNVYNYELLFSCLNTLYQEISDKLTDPEKEDVDKNRDAIKQFMDKYPLFDVKFGRDGGKQISREVNYSYWKVLDGALFDYETKIKKLSSIHGYGSPSQEEEGMF